MKILERERERDGQGKKREKRMKGKIAGSVRRRG